MASRQELGTRPKSACLHKSKVVLLVVCTSAVERKIGRYGGVRSAAGSQAAELEKFKKDVMWPILAHL
eukprot:1384710-Amphidinium_carterae.1